MNILHGKKDLIWISNTSEINTTIICYIDVLQYAICLSEAGSGVIALHNKSNLFQIYYRII